MADEQGNERLLTPSKITAWLDCPHYLTLKHQVEQRKRTKPPAFFGSFAQMLLDKGLEHEAQVLAAYAAEGMRVVEAEPWDRAVPFAEWAARSASLLDPGSDADVLYQVPFLHDGVRGIADFLVREENPDGTTRWDPVDAKLARSSAKPGHVLQLCFYAEAIDEATKVKPAELQVKLGSGADDQVGYEDVRPYWARLRGQLRDVLTIDPGDIDTRPEKCDHCQFCEFQATCEQQWRDEDSLTFVAGIRSAEQDALEDAGVDTLTALAELEPDTMLVDRVRPERLERLRVQAALQVEARDLPEGTPPPFVLIEPGDDPVFGHGFEKLPEPHVADVFLDFEGHPFWRADRGLFFLLGYICQDTPGERTYHALWAHDEDEERERVQELVAFIAERRAAHPGMHVYHYNHTERSCLQSLTAEHAVSQATLDALVKAGVFVDLLDVVRNALQVGVESYGLKYIERLTGFVRANDIAKGASAVVAFEQYEHDGDQAHLDDIAAYNRDDVEATRALRDWLVGQRPAGLAWAVDLDSEQSEDSAERDELVAELVRRFEEGTPEHLVADLLGYWDREWAAYIAPVIGTLSGDPATLLDERSVLAGLVPDGDPYSVVGPSGKTLDNPRLRLRFPPQALDRDFTDGDLRKVVYLTLDGKVLFAAVDSIDAEAGELVLEWDARSQEHATLPGAVVIDEWFDIRSKRAALKDLAAQLLDPGTHGEPNPATMALLRRDPPRFAAGGGPSDGVFTDDSDDLCRWVGELDHSVLAVQGPPGTGKTYRGAHMVKRLVAGGARVGVMAMSHHAIRNFLAELVAVFEDDPAAVLRAVHKWEKKPEPLAGVTMAATNGPLGTTPKYDVIAGTAWAMVSKPVRDKPVDVLFIDEAGQLALVDAVVASMSAGSVVLLGDPQQLPQVARAKHPRGSGASALGHVLGEHTTMPPELGVFIEETRRMHPDVCGFISERIYEGRLSSFADCARQSMSVGTGLRWLRVDHEECATESEQEADVVVAQIRALLGETWTDKDGIERDITVDDVLVVAPYNDQVRLLRERLSADPDTKGVQVGTVDKFQGRQAPVVFFTMASSSADDMPRGPEFLFSRNRLNVAISRAQCLAYLVCTEALLNSRAKNVDEMLMIATLCAFVEYAEERVP